MSESSTPCPEQHPGADIAETAVSPDMPSRLWARVMLIGGALMAAWGSLVSASIIVVLATRDPAPEGPVPLLLGGFVIGVAPILFGGIVCRMGHKILRATQVEAEGPSPATPSQSP